MGKLDGKVALITGASAGFGRATALLFAKEGAKIVITARRQERLLEVVDECKALGAEAVCYAGDAMDDETAAKTVELAIKTFGKIDILINNAGVGRYTPLLESTVEDYDLVMNSNVRSAYSFTRYTVPHMLEKAEGQIIMISSAAGIYGYPNETIYTSSKFALRGFAQALDKEFREKGIKSCAFCPGAGITEFAIGHGRTEEQMANSGMLTANDVAEALLFVCAQSKQSRIMEIRMRAMNEPLTGPGC
ncbi:MAG: SDR family oxidoreductase [Lachnospiraceae bacterium]|nr:SDR family oxidoreductase [Lachnospiraceae bacterium]